MTAVVQLVTVGAPPAGDREGEAVAAALAAAGVPATTRAFVDDDEPALERVLAQEATLTVIVAGAGGSEGEAVRRALARLAGARLVLNERMHAALEEASRLRDRPLPRRAERLALLPQGAVLWPTGQGEPGWLVETTRGAVAVIPRAAAIPDLLERYLLPLVRERVAGRGTVLLRTLKTVGVGIGEVEERLAPWLGPAAPDGASSVTTVEMEGEVWVRLRARGATAEAAAATLATVEAPVVKVLGTDCYGRDAETLESVVGRLLGTRDLTLAVAESCTGGLVGHRLTNVPGSSAYFERGVVVYSNRAKQELLGVPEAVLRGHGAVSAPCAEAMARGVCERSGSPCGLAITGIAGPDGGTAAKPVGTVFIGLAIEGRVTSRRFRFDGDRAFIKWQSAQMALDMLRRGLSAKDDRSRAEA